MNLKALCAAGVMMSMILPAGHTAFANSDAILSSENKVFITTAQSIAATDTAIFTEKTSSVLAIPQEEKPVFSAEAKSELEKPVDYALGECVTLPDGSNFYREGYCFVGWNTDPNADSGFFEIEMKDDTVLYAIWVKDNTDSTTESSIKFTTESSLKFTTESSLKLTTESSMKFEETDISSSTESGMDFKENESYENTDFVQESTTDSSITVENTETNTNTDGEDTELRPSNNLEAPLESVPGEDKADLDANQEDNPIQSETENTVNEEITDDIDTDNTVHNTENNIQEITEATDVITNSDSGEAETIISDVSTDNVPSVSPEDILEPAIPTEEI